MIRNARKGIVKICQNFDGEHVDLAVVKKSVELLGAENILMMTDSIESQKLAGRKLHLRQGSALLYQDDGIVAAGSQGVHRQIENMLSIGLSIDEIKQITYIVPSRIIEQHNEYIRDKVSCL
jgi:N-acetylglucosamine-6-phosphate deacetylase